jgi:hypothetical protein
MKHSATIHLGYEVGTGKPVGVPLLNLAVTGQTQESGKTTTLEALAIRSGAKVITFVTKRGEGSFAKGRRIQPYFRDRADWQFVDAILEAALGEKNKFLRQFLIPICRKTKTLAEVQAAVRTGLKTAKGIREGAFVQLDAYLDLIVPEIARAKLAASLDLRAGLNVMDVSDFATPMQMLFVQSALDWVNDRERDTVVVIPEAWEFIPEGKGSPVKSSAIALVRKGSGIGNRIWVDSQDMAGVDKTILRGCPVWLIGVQREINEIKRNIANIPPPTGKPKPGDVAMLERGQFFACFGKTLVKAYVQPAWMNEATAESIAMGEIPIRDAILPPERGGAFAVHDGEPFPPLNEEELQVNEKEAAALRERNAELERQVAALSAQLRDLTAKPSNHGQAAPRNESPAPAVPRIAAASSNGSIDDATYDAIAKRLVRDGAVLLAIAETRPEIEVTRQKEIIRVSTDKQPGLLAAMIAEGFFNKATAFGIVVDELKRRGRSVHYTNVKRDLNRLAEQGFLTIEDAGYQVVPGMKVNIIEA